MSEVNPIFTDETLSPSVDEKEEVACRLKTDLHKLHTLRCSNLQDRANKEAAQLQKRHQRVVFLHKMQKAVNAAADPKNGTIDFGKYPSLQAIREEALKMNSEVEILKAQIENLENQGKTAEAKEVRQEMDEILEVIDAIEAKSTKTTYSKDDKNNLLERIRLTCEDFNMYIQMQTQTVNRYFNEYNLENMRMADMEKREDSLIKKIAQGIQGR